MAANAPGCSLRLTVSLLTGGEGGILLETGNGNGKGLGKENGGRLKKEKRQADIASQLIGAVHLSLTAGAASVSASAPGAALTQTLALTAGAASIPANAPGSDLSIRVAFGSGRLDKEDGSGLLTEDGSGQLIIEPSTAVGAASGAAGAPGADLVSTLTLTAGAADAGGVANAPGADFEITLNLAPGAASVAAPSTPVTGGGGFWRPDSEWRRLDRKKANAPGALLVIRLDVITGSANGGSRFDPVAMDNDLLLFAA
jgi:hypothetical protein